MTPFRTGPLSEHVGSMRVAPAKADRLAMLSLRHNSVEAVLHAVVLVRVIGNLWILKPQHTDRPNSPLRADIPPSVFWLDRAKIWQELEDWLRLLRRRLRGAFCGRLRHRSAHGLGDDNGVFRDLEAVLQSQEGVAEMQ